MKKFNPNTTQLARAVQAWQILVGKAMTRQTITYLDLSRLMYKKEAQGVLGDVLASILFYCNDNDLPILTVIVVGQNSGKPGPGALRDPANMHSTTLDIDEERERVYATDWYDIYPPAEAELISANGRLASAPP